MKLEEVSIVFMDIFVGSGKMIFCQLIILTFFPLVFPIMLRSWLEINCKDKGPLW